MPPDPRAAASVPPASAAETLAAEFRAVHRAEPLDAHGQPAASEADLRIAQFEAGATALCLSGGGIRSASFCLGVVQGLARRAWMPFPRSGSTRIRFWASSAMTAPRLRGCVAQASSEAGLDRESATRQMERVKGIEPSS